MRGLDTNVLVRLFTRDDPEQASEAAAVLREGRTWIPRTVLLETAWVLRHTYGFESAAVITAFTALLGVDGVEVESRAVVWRALTWHREGVDFADALHLASLPDEATEMVSFDRGFGQGARRVGAFPPVRVLGRPS